MIPHLKWSQYNETCHSFAWCHCPSWTLFYSERQPEQKHVNKRSWLYSPNIPNSQSKTFYIGKCIKCCHFAALSGCDHQRTSDWPTMTQPVNHWETFFLHFKDVAQILILQIISPKSCCNLSAEGKCLRFRNTAVEYGMHLNEAVNDL